MFVCAHYISKKVLAQCYSVGKTPYYEAEYRSRTKSGEWKWILGHGRITKRDEHGRPLQAIGTHVDITKLKQTENELKKREIEVIGIIQDDPVVFEACLEGHALDRGEAFDAAGKILDCLLLKR